MNCPLCQKPLIVKNEGTYIQYPSFRCETKVQVEDWSRHNYETEHYLKYFEADWSYSRYREEATVLPYKIINFYNHRAGKTNSSVIQKYQFIPYKLQISGIKGRNRFVTLLRFEHCLNIPDAEHFINRIKTYLVFS